MGLGGRGGGLIGEAGATLTLHLATQRDRHQALLYTPGGPYPPTVKAPSTKGALDGESPMSHVDFKKWQMTLHYYFP